MKRFLQKYQLRHYGFHFFFLVLALSIFGVLVIKSATDGSADEGIYMKQIMGIGVGIGVMVIVSLIDYHIWLKGFVVIYLLNLVLLVATLFLGKEVGGATRWIVLPVVGQIQPSEFSKLAIVLFFAALFARFKDVISSPVTILITGACAAVPLALILKQPDLSTTIVCFLVIASMLFLAGINYKWILGAFGVVAAAAGAMVYFVFNPEHFPFPDYQLNRILSWIYPDRYPSLVYQQLNSVMAIGSGMLRGKGLNTTTFESVKNGNFLSEAQTDFIFAIIGEELGFVGSCAVIILLAVLIYCCFMAARRAKDTAGKLIAGGIGALLAFQSFVNIGVATFLLPNTGIPLPFVSYGVSSVLSSFIAVGLVLNVGLQRRAS